MLLAFLEFVIIWKIVSGEIRLKYLVSEANGRASFSRFQFLVFTFVIGGLVLVLTLESGEFPKLGPDVLALLGISGGSYVVSKGIQASGGSKKKGDEPEDGGDGGDSTKTESATGVAS